MVVFTILKRKALFYLLKESSCPVVSPLQLGINLNLCGQYNSLIASTGNQHESCNLVFLRSVYFCPQSGYKIPWEQVTDLKNRILNLFSKQ